MHYVGLLPSSLVQSIGCLTEKPEVLVQPHTFVSPSTDSRRAVISYRQKYVHDVLVNRLGRSKPALGKCV